MINLNEDLRIKVVHQFEKLNLEYNGELEDIVVSTSKLFNAPYSSITLVDKDTQWLKVKTGLTIEKSSRELSFCKHTIKSDNLFIVNEMQNDKRFFDHPEVAGGLKIRFYAGAPLITRDGYRIGALCVMDIKSHRPTKQQKLILKILSKHAVGVMESKIALEQLNKSFVDMKRLRETQSKNEIILRSMFESLTDLYFLFGKERETIDFNRAAYDFIKDKYSISLKYGGAVNTFLTDDYQNIFKINFKAALNGEKMQLERFADYGAKGKIWWDCVFEPVRNDLGIIIAVSYVARNITERKLNEEMIIRQNRLLSKIAQIQSHDYRGPVATILGLMNLIEIDGYVASKEYLIMLQQAVKQLDEKIHDVVSIVNDSESSVKKLVN